MSGYRSRIYEGYAVNFQDTQAVFNARAASHWGQAYDYYFRGWLPANKSARIADLACGGGRLLHFFKERGFNDLCGCDISSDQVELAKQVIPEVVHVSVLDFLEANRRQFDLITGLDIAEHFYKDEVFRFLDGCFEALRPGGRLILQTSNAESPWGALHRYDDFTHEVCFSPNALLRLLRVSGFKEVKAREQGPVPWGYSLFSTIRYSIWQAIRFGLGLWNVIETGGPGSGVFTRVFLISGVRK